MSSQRLIEHYSVADYEIWEGDWELIHGMPLAMTPSPGIEHQRASGAIYAQLSQLLDNCPECEPLYEIDVELAEDTVVRPDILITCDSPEGARLTQAPELIVEVISRKTARRDEHTKLQLYAEEGVAHYVLVYPELKKAKVYRLVDGAYRKVGDFQGETHAFALSKCIIPFDFGRIWKRR
ncbi:Uma2 family endonuclease [Thiorhodococcus minor]|uniref:Uma2 family endonuclease n=1 Tax=Thiorhodococcus minor TaxID=57489 RepID=A0A6M0JZQ7_9GAMM|nr:Uma2 family endonuclease [Thiorhodococcus minor]NEV62153.1 Uma2 family endonuclease [Thiorhodococcus minor]